jgi:2-polyprenyl-3-methyl-5-hydroxy-6-metoxy-1,4-benzoquinol methylase
MSDETRLLESVANRYFSPELAGANELYHEYLRDSVIPAAGGASALEIGCGRGLWTSVLCERYDRVDIVDASETLLSVIRRQNAPKRAVVTIHHALVEDFVPPAGRTWQHVYMTFILEHLQDPVAVLRKLRPLLAVGGELIITVPNALSIHRVVAARMGLIGSVYDLSENDRSLGHRRVYSMRRLGALVSKAGYRIVEKKCVGLKPLTLKQLEPLPPDLIRAYCASGDLCGTHGAYLALRATHADL